METRAHHLFIGAFVLVAVVGMLGFVAWLAKVDPMIRSRPSSFQQIFAGAPELLSQLVVLTTQAVDLLNEDNRRAVQTVLADASEVSRALASKSDSFGRILDNIEEATFEMREASAGVNDLVTTLEGSVVQLADSTDATLSVARGALSGLDQIVVHDLRLALADARQTAQSVTETSRQLNDMVAESREPLGDFASEGLYELSGMISDMRVLMTGISRLADRLESDPTQFFFGSSEQGFDAE